MNSVVFVLSLFHCTETHGEKQIHFTFNKNCIFFSHLKLVYLVTKTKWQFICQLLKYLKASKRTQRNVDIESDPWIHNNTLFMYSDRCSIFLEWGILPCFLRALFVTEVYNSVSCIWSSQVWFVPKYTPHFACLIYIRCQLRCAVKVRTSW